MTVYYVSRLLDTQGTATNISMRITLFVKVYSDCAIVTAFLPAISICHRHNYGPSTPVRDSFL